MVCGKRQHQPTLKAMAKQIPLGNRQPSGMSYSRCRIPDCGLGPVHGASPRPPEIPVSLALCPGTELLLKEVQKPDMCFLDAQAPSLFFLALASPEAPLPKIPRKAGFSQVSVITTTGAIPGS